MSYCSCSRLVQSPPSFPFCSYRCCFRTVISHLVEESRLPPVSSIAIRTSVLLPFFSSSSSSSSLIILSSSSSTQSLSEAYYQHQTHFIQHLNFHLPLHQAEHSSKCICGTSSSSPVLLWQRVHPLAVSSCSPLSRQLCKTESWSVEMHKIDVAPSLESVRATDAARLQVDSATLVLQMMYTNRIWQATVEHPKPIVALRTARLTLVTAMPLPFQKVRPPTLFPDPTLGAYRMDQM